MGAMNDGGIYKNMNFPKVPFAEYPKLVTCGGKRIRVTNQKEEVEAIGMYGPVDVKKTALEEERDNAMLEMNKMAAQMAKLQEELAAMKREEKAQEIVDNVPKAGKPVLSAKDVKA